MPLGRLFASNPWWTDAGSIDDEPEIRAWSESGPLGDAEIGFERDDAVYSLRGPRQVGKTTLIKLKIQELLEKVPAKNVLYCPFDVESGPRDVLDVLCEYLEWAGPRTKDRKFMFLDEISSVPDWQRAIKHLRDTGRLRCCTVVTAGSHSADLRRATELLPGRRGSPVDDLDKTMLPLSFGEYVLAVDNSLAKVLRRGSLATRQGRASVARGLARGEVDGDLIDAALMQAQLDSHLDSYMLTGGMPLAVLDSVKRGSVTSDVYKAYLDALGGAIRAAGRSESKAVRLAANIWASLGSAVSWSSLGRGAGMGSYHTAEEYVNMLEDAFVASVLYGYDSSENQPRFGAGKKVYFRDPLFAHALRSKAESSEPFEQSLRAAGDPASKGALVEQIVADHLARLAPVLSSRRAGFEAQYALMHWRSKSGREVDFIVRDQSSLIPVEVKYQSRVRRGDMWGLTDFAKATGTRSGIVVTRDEMRVEGETTLIPASVFLLLA